MPTTEKPITAPAKKAMFKPFSRLSFAASAVRAFDFVAIFIPTKPASPELNAPMKKHTAVCQFMKRAITSPTMTVKMTRNLYSFFKNAKAPIWIALDISCIFSLPGLTLSNFIIR